VHVSGIVVAVLDVASGELRRRRSSGRIEVVDRLAQLQPSDVLDDVVEGLAPEETTGPGGLITQLARAASPRSRSARSSRWRELPARHEWPLGRFSRTELHRLVIEQGVTDASATTIWR
jgi:hypothetical protein